MKSNTFGKFKEAFCITLDGFNIGAAVGINFIAFDAVIVDPFFFFVVAFVVVLDVELDAIIVEFGGAIGGAIGGPVIAVAIIL